MEKNPANPLERAHAKLSASQTKRWMNCPGSVRLIDDMDADEQPKQSSFAALGTVAHALGEICLTAKVKDSYIYKDWWIHITGEIQEEAPDLTDISNAFWFKIDYDMMDAVNIYLSSVYIEMERLGSQSELFIEKRFNLSWIRPDMFGTSDACISLFLEELVVIDYKHGKGIPVEVSYYDKVNNKIVGNTQLMYYLLGCAKDFDFTHKKYTIIVVQPRRKHPHGVVRRFTCTLEDLMEFRDNLAIAADSVNEAYKAWDGCKNDSEYINWRHQYLCAGDHCKKSFCPKIASCPAVYKKTEELIAADFSESL